MLIPTQANVKLANDNTVHAKVIGFIFCHFTKFTVIYTVGQVYYCSDHLSNTISLIALKCYVGFQKFTSEPLEHFDFMDPQDCSWRSPCRTPNNLDRLQIEIVRVNPQRNKDIVSPTIFGILKHNIYQLMHQLLGRVST